jgi:hypothetical protein
MSFCHSQLLNNKDDLSVVMKKRQFTFTGVIMIVLHHHILLLYRSGITPVDNFYNMITFFDDVTKISTIDASIPYLKEK